MTTNHNIPDESFYEILDEGTVFQQGQQDYSIIQKNELEKECLFDSQELIEQHPYSVEYTYEKAYNKDSNYLFLTNYRILLQFKKNPVEYRSIPYGLIQSINPQDNYLSLKNGMKLIINGLGNNLNLCKMIIQSIKKLPYSSRFQQSASKTICRHYHQQVYDCVAEVQRMRIDWNTYITASNKQGRLCISYPVFIVVPVKIKDSFLKQYAKYHYMCRFPILSFHHNSTGGGIWRSAKLKLGFAEANSYYQAYLHAISDKINLLEVGQVPSKTKQKLFKQRRHIKLSSFKQLKEHYETLLVHYLKEEKQDMNGNMKSTKFLENMSPISNFSNAYDHIRPKYSKYQQFHKHLNRWYVQIAVLLHQSFHIASFLEKGQHVIVQEQYALDRVCQLIALASIIIDPYYRTFRGFSVLITKQFLCHGHPLSQRIGIKHSHQQTTSPILVQFLQCLHQLISCFPSYFEYSSAYIARIGFQIYTTKYIDFVSCQNRSVTVKSGFSIWQDMEMKKCYYNYQYKYKYAEQLQKIRKPPSIKQFLIWKQFYSLIGLMQSQSEQESRIKSSSNKGNQKFWKVMKSKQEQNNKC